MARLSCILAFSILAISATGLAKDPADVEQLTWMAGTWRGERGGTSMEEWWTSPRGELHARIEGDTPMGTESSEWVYRKVQEQKGE